MELKREITTQAKIRFSDCDPIGHLNNVRYLDYMLHAREDHVAESFGFTYQDYVKKTGSTWVAIENQIAYLKEVRPNVVVNISSKIIAVGDRTTKVELLMKDVSNQVVHSVLWITAIYFNMKERKSMLHTPDILKFLNSYLVEIPEKTFEERVENLRLQNRVWTKS